ncbi:MAG TPA: MMPL family transporter [Solirubrobacterales bacterium]|jgi:RND superfamily putative drug exporter|nr:MMPL family transporter [Solirubrobacterales bacterium]
MKALPLSLRRPRAVLAAALLIIVALAVLGRGVEDELRPTSLSVPGTESGRAGSLLHRYFGDSAPFAILLQGPPRDLDRQGPALIRALRRDPSVSTLSPWDRGSVGRLRPGPRKALILVDFHVDAETAVRETVPYLDRTLDERIEPPVSAAESGFASLSRAIQDESVHSTEVAELIAIPFLLLVLLLVFRSPVAAAIPLAFGAVTVTASRGVLAIAADRIAIDGFALTVCTMMGLALGVDYALLMVSRFREELSSGTEPREAARMTRRTAGRTTAFAGSTLFLAMLVTLFVMPGTLLISLAGTAIVVTAISVLVAALVGPALLVLLGHNVNRWRIGGEGTGRGVMTLVAGALKRPRLAVLLIGALVLLLAAPTLDLKTGPPSAEQLPTSDPARQEAELISDAVGPGYEAPFVIVAVTEHGTITDPGNLAALSRWQRRIARDPGVQAVIGPAQIKRQVAPLRESGEDLLAGRGEANPEKLQKLGERLGSAANGVGQVRSGLSKAAYGAGLLASGSGRVGEGARQIEGGLARAASGAEKAAGALDRLAAGSGKLAEGQRTAQLGAFSVQTTSSDLAGRLKGSALESARKLRAELQQRSAADPTLAAQAREAERLVEALAIARNEAIRLENQSTRLHEGQTKLADGSAKLHKGAQKLADAAGQAPSGLERLRGGTARLADGLAQLQGGADTLEERLADGFRRSQPLQAGLRRAHVKVAVSADDFEQRVDRLRRSSPGIFESGYFVLSALQGAPPESRKRAGRIVDLQHGGQAAQIVVIPRYTFNTAGSKALNERLKDDARELAAETGTTTGVTGGAAQLIDYTDTISQRIPIVIAVITLATFLILVVILRAVPLAAIAVALNLVTVAVAFGVLTLLFDVPDGWPLGGRTYVDAIGAAGIFGIIFGLSIDYAVFLLMRMREHYENGAPNEEAIVFGLERTARVITGAAAIMMAVFAAFAGAKIATVSQLGIGLTVAVVLDATVIRIVLLPALMLLLGDRIWWLPRPLQRWLPEIDLHGSRAG